MFLCRSSHICVWVCFLCNCALFIQDPLPRWRRQHYLLRLWTSCKDLLWASYWGKSVKLWQHIASKRYISKPYRGWVRVNYCQEKQKTSYLWLIKLTKIHKLQKLALLMQDCDAFFRQTNAATIFLCGAPVLDLNSWCIWRAERPHWRTPTPAEWHFLWTWPTVRLTCDVARYVNHDIFF